LNIGFTSTFALFAYAPNSVVGWLNQMDSSISNSLNVRKTDLATHYFMFFVLALTLAFCMRILLYAFSKTRLAEEALRWVAVFLPLAALPAMRINPWSNEGTLRRILFPLEILSALYLTFRYLQGNWPRSTWTIGVIVAIHFVFWSREFGLYEAIAFMLFRFREFRGYMLFIPDGAPMAWTLAFGSAIVWAFYVRRVVQT
jgi:hypothetical protein